MITDMPAKTNREVALQTQSKVIGDALATKGWTQADLARATGMRVSTISRIRNGITLAPPDAVLRIAEALEIDPIAISQPARRIAPHQWSEGVHRVTRNDGKVQLTVNMVVEPGLARLVETLMDYDEPIGSARMRVVLNALYQPLHDGERASLDEASK